MGVPSPARFFRFGAFQLDLRARELRRNGVKVRVPDQSIQVLAMLLEHPGEVVTREELTTDSGPTGRSSSSTTASMRPLSGCARRWRTPPRPHAMSKLCRGWATVSSERLSRRQLRKARFPLSNRRSAPASWRVNSFRITAFWRRLAAAAWAWSTRPKTHVSAGLSR